MIGRSVFISLLLLQGTLISFSIPADASMFFNCNISYKNRFKQAAASVLTALRNDRPETLYQKELFDLLKKQGYFGGRYYKIALSLTEPEQVEHMKYLLNLKNKSLPAYEGILNLGLANQKISTIQFNEIESGLLSWSGVSERFRTTLKNGFERYPKDAYTVVNTWAAYQAPSGKAVVLDSPAGSLRLITETNGETLIIKIDDVRIRRADLGDGDIPGELNLGLSQLMLPLVLSVHLRSLDQAFTGIEFYSRNIVNTRLIDTLRNLGFHLLSPRNSSLSDFYAEAVAPYANPNRSLRLDADQMLGGTFLKMSITPKSAPTSFADAALQVISDMDSKTTPQILDTISSFDNEYQVWALSFTVTFQDEKFPLTLKRMLEIKQITSRSAAVTYIRKVKKELPTPKRPAAPLYMDSFGR